MTEVHCGDLGEPRREIEVEPLEEPGRVPVPEPEPAPEKVPA